MEYRITRSGPLVQLKPWSPGVESLLQYDHVAFAPGSKTPATERRLLYHLDPKEDCGYFPVACAEDVMDILRKGDHSVIYEDPRDMRRFFPEPQWDRVDELRSGQKEVLEAIVKNDHGLIVCSTGFGKSFCIKQICKMYPKLNFIIVAPGVAEMINLYQPLMAEFGVQEVGSLGGSGRNDPTRRITVSTMASLAKADFSRCEIFIFDEAHSLGHNKTTFRLMGRLEDSRVYGFTATPVGRSDHTDNVIKAVFGRELVNYTYQECEAAGSVTPIDVFIYDIEGDIESSQSSFGNTFIANKRRFYWRNELRNVCIAALATVIPKDQQVLIMVESVDHLITLGQYLPDYALVCGAGNDLDLRARKRRIKLTNRMGDSKEENKKIYAEFKEGTLKRVISSMTWKQGVSFDGLNVLIRADGSPSKISSTQIPGRLSRLAPGKDKAILVDFADKFNPTAKNNFYSRLRNYRKNGWRIVMKGDPLDEKFE